MQRTAAAVKRKLHTLLLLRARERELERESSKSLLFPQAARERAAASIRRFSHIFQNVKQFFFGARAAEAEAGDRKQRSSLPMC